MVTRHCFTGRMEHIAAEHGDLSTEYIRAMADPPAMCMLELGHDGFHEWTLNSDITIRLVEGVPIVEVRTT